ncbi:MAG: AraC family transcriptional regulator [Chlorobi bacterium]|nr:AraC family transcriptional regulator [Chlorobiota bacterium]
MKIMHEQVDFPGRAAIKVKWREIPHFTYPWHFHNQYELVYVIESYGTRFIGDSIESFEAGDLVFIGSNLPHFWKSDEAFHQGNPDLMVRAIVIQFHSDFLINAIINYTEFYHIKKLLNQSSRGIRFLNPTLKKVKPLLYKMPDVSGLERIILMLQILDILARSNSYKILGSEAYQPKVNEFTTDRLDKVINYLNYHYREKISLEDVASLANLHPSAFCRFFKEKTGKSLSAFVNDMRINYACKLIIDGKLSVSQVCFESGFNNLSNFNRTFKQRTGFTPSQYQLEFYMGNKSLVDEVV